jgi:predicted MFS family arabinose efflux permease
MASDAVAALLLGHIYDRRGLVVVAAAAAVAALASPLVFLGGADAAFAGMILWGAGMGAQESIMRAVVAGMTPPDRRGTAFGILNAVFGVAWFAGSVLLGVVYDQSVWGVAALSLVVQLLALPLLAAIIWRSAEP